MMLPCWNTSATSRPSFADVINTLDTSFSDGAAGDEYYFDTSKVGQDTAEDDGLYTDNVVKKPQ